VLYQPFYDLVESLMGSERECGPAGAAGESGARAVLQQEVDGRQRSDVRGDEERRFGPLVERVWRGASGEEEAEYLLLKRFSDESDNSTRSEQRGVEGRGLAIIILVASLLVFVLTVSHHRAGCERSEHFEK